MTERRITALEGGLAAEIFDELDSTNAEALRRIRTGKPREEWIVADHQTAGRGRMGRQWISSDGNLFATRIYNANCPRARAPELSFVAALATHDAVALAVTSATDVRCKWPNDILINGAKAAGILLETEGGGATAEWVAIGVGVNVASAPEDVIYPATCIAKEDGQTNCEDVLRLLNERMTYWLGKWSRSGFRPIREAWKKVAANLDDIITVRTGEGDVTGRFIDVDEHGALILEMESGETRIMTTGDVALGE